LEAHIVNLPLVSICIPACNAERFIAETLRSALAQTYPNIEILVSDDASTDQTRAIVERYTDRGVGLLVHSRNLGMCGNWNAVIRASTGKYVCKLDADDMLAPEYVSEMVTVMENHPDVSFAHCACKLIDIDGKFIGYERSIHGSFIRSGLQEWPRYVFGPKAVNIVMIRKSAFEQVGGYDGRYKYSGDWAMHRALLRIGSVYYNDHVVATYRCHDFGKAGVRLLQAKEHLMHLSDMEKHWPKQVPGKARLLRAARRHFALATARSAAYVSGKERQEILNLVSSYDGGLEAQLMTTMIGLGGGAMVRAYDHSKLVLRQRIKQAMYK
jgi:glycosyltransferase involved in cell wall biosynthesis